MNRLEEIRKVIDPILLNMTDTVERRCAYIHLYGVSKLAAMLAFKRELDPEIAAVSGMLHDLYAYRTGETDQHDHKGAEEDAKSILHDIGIFNNDEQALITSAVYHHSDKDQIHQPYDELLKDADVLQHYLYNTGFPVSQKKAPRLKAILTELGLPCDFEVV